MAGLASGSKEPDRHRNNEVAGRSPRVTAAAALLAVGALAAAAVCSFSDAVPAAAPDVRPPGVHHSPLLDVRVARGQLWPAFSPKVLNYEVELDAEMPALELSLRASGGAKVRVDDEELPLGVLHRSVHLGRLAKYPKARYQLVQLEVLASGAEQCHNYALRVLRPPAGPRPVKRSPARHLLSLSTKTAPGTAVVRSSSQSRVGITVVDGRCALVGGPLREESPTADKLGLWSVKTEHVLCFSMNKKSDDHMRFVASALQEGQGGEFGFGQGINVSLRPNIQTNAVWPLEAGVESLGLDFEDGKSLRTLALRTTVAETVYDVPVVLARPQLQHWPVTVEILDGSLGSCTPAEVLDMARVACRILPDKAGTTARLVAICRSCMQEPGANSSDAWLLRVQDTQAVSDASEGLDIRAPWVGWSAKVPGKGDARLWTVTLRRAGSTSPAEELRFEVALVSGDSTVPWTLHPTEVTILRAAGLALSLLVVLALGAVAIVLGLTVRGLPVPTVALLPPMSSAALSIQFLATLGSAERAPKLLSSLCSELTWLTAEPWLALLWAFIGLTLVAVAHGLAVCLFFMRNGRGSSQVLPHGLLFGAWELRVLELTALPIAASAAALAVHGGFTGVVGCAVLAGLATAGAAALRHICTWLADERIGAVVLPGSAHHVFVDRACDQLRALPVAPGPSSLLGSWPASPAWCFAPSVGAIVDLEHRGSNEREVGRSWATVWPAGPWARSCGAEDTETPERRRTSRNSSNRSLRARRQSSASSASSTLVQGTNSPVFFAHPVRAKIEFPYRNHRHPCVAGVVGLPWITVAVLADSLPNIRATVGDFSLQAHVGQLSGPLTCGRLAACFDWGTRQPWRWPADLVLRLALGIYLGAMPLLRTSLPLVAAALDVGFAAVVAVLAAGVSCTRPYVHATDNVALGASLLAVSLSMALHAGSERFPVVSAVATALLVVLAAAPVLLLAIAAFLAAGFACRWAGEDLHETVLPETVHEWESSPKGALHGKSPSATVVLLAEGTEVAEPVIELPAEVRLSVVHQELKCDKRAMPVCSVCTRRMRLPMPAGLLFMPGQSGNLQRAVATPFAAVITPRCGQLLYTEMVLNGGIDWTVSAKNLLHNRALAVEAERVMREHDEDVDRPVVVLEVDD